jgi:hypothetical protein
MEPTQPLHGSIIIQDAQKFNKTLEFALLILELLYQPSLFAIKDCSKINPKRGDFFLTFWKINL